MTVKETYTLGGDESFLYSKYSEYIHETKTGITPSKKDTWRHKTKLHQKTDLPKISINILIHDNNQKQEKQAHPRIIKQNWVINNKTTLQQTPLKQTETIYLFSYSPHQHAQIWVTA